VRRHRARQRERERAKGVAPKVPKTADFKRMEQFDDGELLRLLSTATCACNGRHILDEDQELGERCVRCGRQRPESARGQELLGQLVALGEAVSA